MSSLVAYLLPDPEHSAAARPLGVLGYTIAALLWLRKCRRVGLAQADSLSGWWRSGAVLLFLLAINKLFNLRAQLEAGFRALAKSEGWYERREPAQFALAILLPLLLAVITAAFLTTRARGFVRGHYLALAGWLLLLFYLALRQTQEWKPVLSWLEAIRYYDWRLALECAGIALVALAALREPPPRS
jgi:hypothetical protein